MTSAKDLILRPIDSAEANALMRRLHYSHRVVRNSQLHIGVFWQGALAGALQFGPPLDKRKVLGLVRGTRWQEMLELNRLALAEQLPRNSESRAIAVACRLLRRHAPQVKWILSFADATQCGDGTIYRAAGFVLTAIKPNDQIWALPDGAPLAARVTLTKGPHILHTASLRPGIGAIGQAGATGGASSMKAYEAQGARPLPGFQLRYVKFLDPTWADRLTVPVLPYAAIAEAGARMVRGRSAENGTAATSRRGRCDSDPPAPDQEADACADASRRQPR